MNRTLTVVGTVLLALLASCRSSASERPHSFIVVTSSSWSEGNLPEDCFTFTTEEELTVLIVNCSGVVTLGLYRGTSLWRGKVISARADETSCWVIGTLSVGKYKLRVNAHDGEQRLYLREGHYPLTVVPGREISLPQTEPPNSQ